MKYGIGFLSVIPMRAEPSDQSEMVNQLLFGEMFTVINQQQQWLEISLEHDGYYGWIDIKQVMELEEAFFQKLISSPKYFNNQIIELLTDENGSFLSFLLLGALLPDFREGTFRYGNKRLSFNGNALLPEQNREQIIRTAFDFLNAPYLWGGRTPMGIDCSGLTQMAYRFGGISLLRDASQQATQGHTLSFIEEALPGDLAFFDNEEGRITHVGLILPENKIIHASGRVRIDRLDQTGIYNERSRKHTHKLRLMKSLF
jgi:hypothetical protein